MKERHDSSKSGRAILTGMLLLLIGGFVALSGAHVAAEYLGGFARLALVLGWAVSILSILAICFGVVRWRSRRREFELARRDPDAFVFGSARPDGLLRALRDISGISNLHAPTDMSVVADADGVAFWKGSPRLPELIYRLSWTAVQSIEAGPIMMAGARHQGLNLGVVRGQQQVGLALQPIGAGLLAMYPLPSSDVEQIVRAFHTRAPGVAKS